jgi:RNA polymerase sigma-70 factor (ECF subfamily)
MFRSKILLGYKNPCFRSNFLNNNLKTKFLSSLRSGGVLTLSMGTDASCLSPVARAISSFFGAVRPVIEDFSACDSAPPRYDKRMKDTPVPDPRQFATTHWSLVGAAKPGEASQTRAREALEKLCRAYWYPLYAFVRSGGYSAVDAQDLTQAFFARFIETDGFASADRERGRFRSYLLGAMKHFLANQWHRAQTQKRGGQVQFIEFDALDPEARYAGASEQSDNPELLFDREWALQTIAGALQSLRDEMAKAGKSEQFEALKSSLTGEDEMPRDVIAAKLGMSEGAVKVAVHRLRQRYRKLLRAAIAETVSNEADLDDEMRYLVAVLRRR